MMRWLLLCTVVVPSALAASAEEYRLHVDAERGADDPSRDGSAALPFLTLGRAFALAAELASASSGQAGGDAGLEGAPDVTIVILGGLYGPLEEFPLRVPGGLGSLSLIGQPVGSRRVVIECAGPSVAFELDPLGEAPWRLAFEGIAVRGGRTAISVAAGLGSPLELHLAECSFEGQLSTSVEVLVAEEATADCRVSRSSFRGASGGILAETGPSSDLTLLFEDCRVEDLTGYGPTRRLGAGVDVHADPLAHVRATVARTRFSGAASAVQITTAEDGPDGDGAPARIEVEVLGNLVVGLESSAPENPSSCVPRSGLYLSIWPHHDVSLLVASNTFFGIEGPVIFHDNLESLEAQGEEVPLVFVNNICRGGSAPSEFDFESAGEEIPGFRRTIAHNCLERSRLGAEGISGNTADDPLLVDPEGGDLRLRPESPAVDRGLSGYARGLELDLDGACRRSSPSCDLERERYPIDIGAYELPGFCDVDVDLFERGDCNRSGGALEISDAILAFSFLFLGEDAPPLLDACDSNDDGRLDITDGIFVLAYLFLGGFPPPPPFPEPGTDPSRDCLALR